MCSNFTENVRNIAFNDDIINICIVNNVCTFFYLFTREAMLRYYIERSVLHTV